MITDVAGVRAGHWTDEQGRTGCTVVLLPAGTTASGEVRGGAPGTREFDLLVPGRLVARVDAVVLTGGSAFGLAACDGVVRWCEERGMGFPTSAGVVPIVVGMVLYDLGVGDATARPGADEGYAACVAATADQLAMGPVGAATGATVGNWWGPDHVRPGGMGTASEREGQLIVSALVAVNAAGDLAERVAGRDLPEPGDVVAALANTTIGVVVTNATLDKAGCRLVAEAGHGGLSRVLEPAHATVDGDALVAAATGAVEAPVDVVRVLAARAVARAVHAAIG